MIKPLSSLPYNQEFILGGVTFIKKNYTLPDGHHHVVGCEIKGTCNNVYIAAYSDVEVVI